MYRSYCHPAALDLVEVEHSFNHCPKAINFGGCGGRAQPKSFLYLQSEQSLCVPVHLRSHFAPTSFLILNFRRQPFFGKLFTERSAVKGVTSRSNCRTASPALAGSCLVPSGRDTTPTDAARALQSVARRATVRRTSPPTPAADRAGSPARSKPCKRPCSACVRSAFSPATPQRPSRAPWPWR